MLRKRLVGSLVGTFISAMVLISGCRSSNQALEATTTDTETTIETSKAADQHSQNHHQWTVNVDSPTIDMSETLWGAFFEDINHSGDQGLYAEMVHNRSFEEKLQGWSINQQLGGSAQLNILTQEPLNENNTHYLDISGLEKDEVVIANKGLDYMSFSEGDQYLLTFYIRTDEATTVEAAFMDSSGEFLSDWESVTVADTFFTKKSITMTTNASSSRGSLVLKLGGPVQLDMVSLFPAETFMGRDNGLRADLAQLIADAKPSFFRFPGGCIVEGNSMDTAYNWKDTVGPVESRPANENLWGYQQSYGLGFFEYFQFCEDIGAEPLPVINVGMACQVRGGDMIRMNDLDPYIQDALDLVEFANGSVDSDWGSLRAQMGHPERFDMKYLAIGNEQWGSEYYKRYDEFAAVIREVYPDIQLVFAAGTAPEGTMFDNAWDYSVDSEVDLIDEHFYMAPEWFLTNIHRYDDYDRDGAKVFIGEYAAHSSGRRNDMTSALAEAAFMTGVERNADVVAMASYAPLLAYEGHQQWSPDLIWFDNDQSYGTPNYYVQKLYSIYRGDQYLENSLSLAESTEDMAKIRGAVGIGTWNTQAVYRNIQITSNETGELIYENSGDDVSDMVYMGGDFRLSDEGIAQTSSDINAVGIFGDRDWSDYTIELEAKKTGGAEGFLIMFGSGSMEDFYWWNIGGWNNTQTAIEKAVGGSKTLIGGSTSLGVNTGQWYEIKIVVSGQKIECYLDGKLIHSVEDQLNYDPVYTSAVISDSGDITLKLVNVNDQIQTLDIELEGIDIGDYSVSMVELAANTAGSVNSLAQPENIHPITTNYEIVDGAFELDLTPLSLTILYLEK